MSPAFTHLHSSKCFLFISISMSQGPLYGGSTPFTTLPNSIIRGGHGGLNIAVLLAIFSHGLCWASAATLAKEVGCGRTTIFRAIKYWKEHGAKVGIFLKENRSTEQKTGKTTTYEIVFGTCTTGEHPKAGRVPPANTGCTTGEHLRVPPANTKKNPEKKIKEEEGNFSLKKEDKGRGGFGSLRDVVGADPKLAFLLNKKSEL